MSLNNHYIGAADVAEIVEIAKIVENVLRSLISCLSLPLVSEVWLSLSIRARPVQSMQWRDGLFGSISAVPEPSTWAMLLIGFAGIGFAAYRKRQRHAAATTMV
jgi:hypothetical protein